MPGAAAVLSARSHAGVAVSGRGHMAPNTRERTTSAWLRTKPSWTVHFPTHEMSRVSIRPRGHGTNTTAR